MNEWKIKFIEKKGMDYLLKMLLIFGKDDPDSRDQAHIYLGVARSLKTIYSLCNLMESHFVLIHIFMKGWYTFLCNTIMIDEKDETCLMQASNLLR